MLEHCLEPDSSISISVFYCQRGWVFVLRLDPNNHFVNILSISGEWRMLCGAWTVSSLTWQTSRTLLTSRRLTTSGTTGRASGPRCGSGWTTTPRDRSGVNRGLLHHCSIRQLRRRRELSFWSLTELVTIPSEMNYDTSKYVQMNCDSIVFIKQ